jgi:hypothetical protein
MKNIPRGIQIPLSFGQHLLITSYQKRLVVSPSASYIMRPFGSSYKTIKIVCEEGILLYSGSITSRQDIQSWKQHSTMNM